jgi:hypothetical protein
MKRRTTLLAICIGVALLAVLAIQHSSQAQRPGGAGGGATRQPPGGQAMMMRSLPLESSWAYISFELGVADAELSKARKSYQEAWNGRKDLAKKMEEARGDREVMRSIRSDIDKLKSDLDTKLKDVLSSEQLEKLAKWEKEEQERARQAFGRQQPRQQQR